MGAGFPFRIRFLLACDPKLCCAVRRIFARGVLDFVERRAREQGHASLRSGAVVFLQRFGAALDLNLHIHALVLDGTYGAEPGQLAPRFHTAAPLEDEHVVALAADGRVVYGLRRHWRDGTSAVSFDPRTFSERRSCLACALTSTLVTTCSCRRATAGPAPPFCLPSPSPRPPGAARRPPTVLSLDYVRTDRVSLHPTDVDFLLAELKRMVGAQGLKAD